MAERKRVLTWHVHGSYLLYLVQAPHDFYLPVAVDGVPGYGGRAGDFPWPDNVIEVPATEVAQLDLDCVIFQSRRNWEQDQFEILSPKQRLLPRIYIEHDPPREHPTDTRHWVDDPDVLIVHVTPFNDLMWDNAATPTQVIDHGVLVPDGVRYSGELARGIVVVNNLAGRGRRLGADVYDLVSRDIPMDLVGMGSEELGGLGEIPMPDLPAFMARYRFFFNPIRYTSMGLAVCEAMTIGMPIVGLATTEMAMAIENGVSGYVDTRVDALIRHMRRLLDDHEEARRLGEGARHKALERFGLDRFTREWDLAIRRATSPTLVSPIAKTSQ
jgi:hypothetical protein